ncbi:hypothetical protein [Thermocatellispora tengchongensis]|uniref:hypothetical protein n=1 Tax=Thermocatellispora tengchongensis TaxID=1073253 RepID=UPI003645C72F
MPRQVSAIDGRPAARGGLRRSPKRATAAAARWSAAAARRVCPGESTAISAPPAANPQICTAPTDMFSTERPSR